MVAIVRIMKGARHGEQPFDQLDTSSKLCLGEALGTVMAGRTIVKRPDHSISCITLRATFSC